jgi:hypothetical protein
VTVSCAKVLSAAGRGGQEDEAQSGQAMQGRAGRQRKRLPQQKRMFLLLGVIVEPDQRFDPAVRKLDRDLRRSAFRMIPYPEPVQRERALKSVVATGDNFTCSMLDLGRERNARSRWQMVRIPLRHTAINPVSNQVDLFLAERLI